MPLVLVVIGIALLLVAALGPRFGLGSRTATPQMDQRRATILILRILAALLGLWLLFFSIVHVLHGHGRLLPSSTQDVR